MVGLLDSMRALLLEHPGWKFIWAPPRQNQLAHLLAAWISRHFRFGFLDPLSLPFAVSHVDYFEPPSGVEFSLIKFVCLGGKKKERDETGIHYFIWSIYY